MNGMAARITEETKKNEGKLPVKEWMKYLICLIMLAHLVGCSTETVEVLSEETICADI